MTDPILVGLLYRQNAGIARWSWYIGSDYCEPYSLQRHKALDDLARELKRREQRGYALGTDRPLSAYLADTGRAAK